MRVSVLTVSDSSSKDASLDKSGPLLVTLLKDSSSLGNPQIVSQSIVPDDFDTIRSTLISLAAECDVLLTTGGTGFSPRDVTPEATNAVIQRECNGLSMALIMRGLKATPFAALTRLTAGILNTCLVVNLPGSPKAVKESFEVLEKLLPHAVQLINGDTHQVKEVHSSMQGQQ